MGLEEGQEFDEKCVGGGAARAKRANNLFCGAAGDVGPIAVRFSVGVDVGSEKIIAFLLFCWY